jgi:hypothetical protein
MEVDIKPAYKGRLTASQACEGRLATSQAYEVGLQRVKHMRVGLSQVKRMRLGLPRIKLEVTRSESSALRNRMKSYVIQAIEGYQANKILASEKISQRGVNQVK